MLNLSWKIVINSLNMDPRNLLKLLCSRNTPTRHVYTGEFIIPYWYMLIIKLTKRRGSVVVSTFAWHAAGRWFDSRIRHVSLLGVKTWLSKLEIVYLCVFRRRH